MNETEVAKWLEAQAKLLPPGLTLHRSIWQLAVKSLKSWWIEEHFKRMAQK